MNICYNDISQSIKWVGDKSALTGLFPYSSTITPYIMRVVSDGGEVIGRYCIDKGLHYPIRANITVTSIHTNYTQSSAVVINSWEEFQSISIDLSNCPTGFARVKLEAQDIDLTIYELLINIKDVNFVDYVQNDTLKVISQNEN